MENQQPTIVSPPPKIETGGKKGRIYFVAFIIILLLVVLGIFLKSKKISFRGTPKGESTLVATDPKFEEVEGALLSGFPEIPVYPNAKLVGSAYTTLPNDPNKGYRAKWETEASVDEVIDWYQDELAEEDWVFEPPDDTNASEQIMPLQKSGWNGYIAVEKEDEETEIVIDIAETGL